MREHGFVGHAGFPEAVLRLVRLHRVFRARAKDAVRRVGQILLIAQALLHLAHVGAPVAVFQRIVQVERGNRSGENFLLEFHAGHAVFLHTQIALQELHGFFGERAINPVRLVHQILQIDQPLLQAHHRRPFVAPG